MKSVNFKPNYFYHIYTRGVNGVNLFYREKNYGYFLQKFDKYLSPFVEVFAYCLMPNHFHFLIRIKTADQNLTGFKNLLGLNKVQDQIRLLLMSYSKAINKQQERTGSLFERPFKRKEVNNLKYLKNLTHYIHSNPKHHGFVEKLEEWSYSSYNRMLLEKPSKLKKKEVLDWFGGREDYKGFHKNDCDIKMIEDLIIE